MEITASSLPGRLPDHRPSTGPTAASTALQDAKKSLRPAPPRFATLLSPRKSHGNQEPATSAPSQKKSYNVTMHHSHPNYIRHFGAIKHNYPSTGAGFSGNGLIGGGEVNSSMLRGGVGAKATVVGA
ncbi:hypothetical protein E2562_005515 [Oryza meyeriana var. granulata]|uniref:Uncharacterized protein n=1 Tax=Oryza meyeriana var. granulata TaxID=110450 RepID=A0A6G1F3Q1_9ORYZ|nr:hypothetical protein E2562_005515 [Oryza meyeriana var. granulata]